MSSRAIAAAACVAVTFSSGAASARAAGAPPTGGAAAPVGKPAKSKPAKPPSKPPKPAVTLGAVKVSAGTLDPKKAAAAVRARLAEIDGCRAGSPGKGGPSGTATFAVSVSAEGVVEAVEVASSALGDEAVVACVRERLMAIAFPAPGRGRGAVLSCALTFEVPGVSAAEEAASSALEKSTLEALASPGKSSAVADVLSSGRVDDAALLEALRAAEASGDSGSGTVRMGSGGGGGLADLGSASTATARPGPRVKLESVEVDGALTPDEARAGLARHLPGLRACYEKGLARDPTLNGRLDVRLVVAAAGTVAAVETSGSTLRRGAAVEVCVVARLGAARFPPRDTAVLAISFRLSFVPPPATAPGPPPSAPSATRPAPRP